MPILDKSGLQIDDTSFYFTQQKKNKVIQNNRIDTLKDQNRDQLTRE